MSTRPSDPKSERLAQVDALIRDKVDAKSRDAVTAFARECFRQLDPEDLAERDAADLYGAALSLWNLARLRKPGVPRIRVLNPATGEHGWQSRHTVIQIVNDDMPFLVDSVTMEINRTDWRCT
jgi:glutamate dehydrogenase